MTAPRLDPQPPRAPELEMRQPRRLSFQVMSSCGRSYFNEPGEANQDIAVICGYVGIASP